MSRLLEISKLPPIDVYKLLVGMIGPRPIGWISTISDAGVSNLAPYSFFNMFGNNPPVLGFSPAISRDGKIKDTLINVRETKCFVHNVVTKDVAEAMNRTSEAFPYGVSEFEKVGLTGIPGSFVAAHRVKEAAISMECKLNQIISLGDKPGNGQIVLGDMVAIHINDESILGEDGLVDSTKLKLISRLGKADYLDFGSVFSLPRLM